jgi:hypothetical protein
MWYRATTLIDRRTSTWARYQQISRTTPANGHLLLHAGLRCVASVAGGVCITVAVAGCATNAKPSSTAPLQPNIATTDASSEATSPSTADTVTTEAATRTTATDCVVTLTMAERDFQSTLNQVRAS